MKLETGVHADKTFSTGSPRSVKKSGKNIFSRSGNCQGILKFVNKFWSLSKSQGKVRGFRSNKYMYDKKTSRTKATAHCKSIRRFYGKIPGIWLPVLLPLFLRAFASRTFLEIKIW